LPELLVIVNVYRPDLGGGILFADLCEGLSERGIEVTVKCAYSYYPEWKDKSGQNGFRIRSTIENGVRIERHGIYIPGNPNSLLQRLLYEASFYFSLRRRLPVHNSFDAVMVFCPLVGAVAYGIAAGRKIHAPVWLNVQDLSAQAATASGITKAGRLSRILNDVQNYLFRRSQYWSTLSPAMMKSLRQAVQATDTSGPDSEDIADSDRMRILPNWLHASLEEEIRLSTIQNPEGETQILYSGNIGSKQDLQHFLSLLLDSAWDFHLRIHGDGARAPEVKRWVEDFGDPRFSVHPLTDEAGLARSLRESDFYLITERTGAGGSFVPSKMIPAISSSVPIIAVCDVSSPLGTEVDRYGLGPRIDWENAPAGIVNLSKTSRTDEVYRTWKRNSSNRASYYNRRAGIDRYESFLRHIISDTAEDSD
jgi:putative colanic acid biosynthesis glycosyltransferase WcaI